MNRRKILLESNLTYLNYVKSIPFKIIAVIGLLIIIIALNFNSIIDLFTGSTNVYKVGIVVTNDKELNKEINLDNNEIKYENIRFEEMGDYIGKLENYDSEYIAILYVNTESNNVDLHYKSNLDQNIISKVMYEGDNLSKQIKFINLGYSNDEINSLMGSNIRYYEHNSNSNTVFISTIANCLLFTILVIYVVYLGNIVIEEKTNRISETLLSYISPLELLVGKLLGIFLALLTHISIFTISYIISINIFGTSGNFFVEISKAFNSKTLVMMLFMLVLGYVCYGFLYMSNSSYVDTIQDAGPASIIQTMILLISFYISFVLQLHFDKFIAEILIYIPFVSVFSNIVYVSVTNPSWIKIFSVILVQCLYVAVIGIICAKSFRNGITKYGRSKKRKKICTH